MREMTYARKEQDDKTVQSVNICYDILYTFWKFDMILYFHFLLFL